ncbi:hypothetical protein GN956_G26012 [Arapaima gigas]
MFPFPDNPDISAQTTNTPVGEATSHSHTPPPASPHQTCTFKVKRSQRLDFTNFLMFPCGANCSRGGFGFVSTEEGCRVRMFHAICGGKPQSSCTPVCVRDTSDLCVCSYEEMIRPTIWHQAHKRWTKLTVT